MSTNIEGVIVKRKRLHDDGGRVSRHTITVQDDEGTRYWGTCPKPLHQCRVGDRAKFVASVTKASVNRYWFFSRPRKAEYVKRVEK